MLSIKVIQSLDVYFFSLLILCLIGIKTFTNPNGKTSQALAFQILLILNFLIIIADSITVLFEGHAGAPVRIFLMTATVFGYCMQVLICLFWFWYARMLIFRERRLRRIVTFFQSLPAMGSMLIAIASCWTGWLFRYDSDNHYSRGPFFLLIIGVSFLYIIVGYYMIIRYRKNLEKRYFNALISFALPPALGGLIQSFIYGVSLIWSCATISLLIIYLAIQNELLLLDYLTGIHNRMSFDLTLRRKILNTRTSSPFALMLLDIDNFRSINDRYGHIECDTALKVFARILNDCFRRDGFVARYGGDEFAVILDMQDHRDMDESMKSLQDRIDSWNESSGKPWVLSYSVGYAPYLAIERLSADAFIMKVDKLLILDKIVPGERRFRKSRR